jgi:hypothetical protein
MQIAVRLVVVALVSFCSTLLAACGAMVHQEYYSSRTNLVQNRSDMTCASPVELTIGCNTKRLANLSASVHGVEMSLASSADGTNVLVWSSRSNKYSSMTANLAYDAARTELERNGVKLLSVTAIKGNHFGDIELVMGYLLALDEDGFRFLSPYVTDKIS